MATTTATTTKADKDRKRTIVIVVIAIILLFAVGFILVRYTPIGRHFGLGPAGGSSGEDGDGSGDSAATPIPGQAIEPFGGYAGGNMPRGIFNKNPLNIMLTSIPWMGKIPNKDNSDQDLGIKPAMEQFYTYEDGLRAAIINMDSQIKDGYDTLDTLIPRWAGGHNSNYINFVKDAVHKAGFDPEAKLITSNRVMPAAKQWPLMRAMAIFENGSNQTENINQMKGEFDNAYLRVKTGG